jgi:hypothetical protein
MTVNLTIISPPGGDGKGLRTQTNPMEAAT